MKVYSIIKINFYTEQILDKFYQKDIFKIQIFKEMKLESIK